MTDQHDEDPLEEAMPRDEVMAFDMQPVRLRSLINGLRALPNVSDMAVINAIAELDRIASIFENAEKKRAEMVQAAIDGMRRTILEGKAEATPGCQCPRCTMIRSVLEQRTSLQ